MIENKPSFVPKRYVYTNLFVDQVEPLNAIIGSNNQYTGLRKYDDLVAIIQSYLNTGLLTIPNLTYQNGLTKTLNVVELGGNLLHHTEINGVNNTYDMNFRDIKSFTVSSDEMDIYSNNNMLVTGLDTSIKGSSTLSLNTPNIQNNLGIVGQVFTLIDPLNGSGEWQTLTFPTDIFLQSGTFNTTTNNLELTLNNSNQINIPMSALLPVVTDSTLSGNGTISTPLTIAQQGAVTNDVLTWNGSTWIPKSTPSICEMLDTIPDGNYTLSTKFVGLQGVNIPSNYVGFDFDLPNQFGTTDASNTYLHLCGGYGGQAFYPPGIS